MASVTIAGTLFSDTGTTPITAGCTLAVSVNGAAAATTVVTSVVDGTYTTAAITVNSGDVLTIYIQDGVNTQKAVTVTKGTGSNMTGIDLYQNYLVLRSDNGVALTSTNLNTSDANGATGISAIFTASSNASCVTASGKNLLVASGQSFTSGAGSTVTITAADFVCNGTFTAGSVATTNFGGSVTNNGTMTIASSSPTNFRGASSHTIKSNGATWPIGINTGGGTYTLQDALAATSVVINNSGTLDVSASNFAITFTGNWSNILGTFVARSGTVTGNSTVATTVRGGGSAFYNLTLNGSGGTSTLNTTGLTISNNLTIGASHTLDVSASNFAVSVGGNWSNSGTFTAQSGTVTLNGAGGTTQTITGSTTFYTLTATAAAARTITFTDGTTQTVSNSLTLTGSAGQLLTLQGSSTGGWTLAVPSTQSISYVSVSRSTATGNAAAAGATSTDGGSNVNWTFGAAGRVIGSPIVGSSMIVGGGIVGGFGR